MFASVIVLSSGARVKLSKFVVNCKEIARSLLPLYPIKLRPEGHLMIGLEAMLLSCLGHLREPNRLVVAKLFGTCATSQVQSMRQHHSNNRLLLLSSPAYSCCHPKSSSQHQLLYLPECHSSFPSWVLPLTPITSIFLTGFPRVHCPCHLCMCAVDWPTLS